MQTVANKDEVKKELLNLDLLRTLFLCQIARSYLDQITEWEQTPIELKVLAKVSINAISATQDELAKPATDLKWLTQTLQKDKLFDIATIVELMAKIGYEEKQEEYEEFVGMLTDCLSAILYAQEHRKKIFFPKYKALFELMASELRADTNLQPGQLWYRFGELFMRTAAPDHKSEMK